MYRNRIVILGMESINTFYFAQLYRRKGMGSLREHICVVHQNLFDGIVAGEDHHWFAKNVNGEHVAVLRAEVRETRYEL